MWRCDWSVGHDEVDVAGTGASSAESRSSALIVGIGQVGGGWIGCTAPPSRSTSRLATCSTYGSRPPGAPSQLGCPVTTSGEGGGASSQPLPTGSSPPIAHRAMSPSSSRCQWTRTSPASQRALAVARGRWPAGHAAAVGPGQLVHEGGSRRVMPPPSGCTPSMSISRLAGELEQALLQRERGVPRREAVDEPLDPELRHRAAVRRVPGDERCRRGAPRRARLGGRQRPAGRGGRPYSIRASVIGSAVRAVISASAARRRRRSPRADAARRRGRPRRGRGPGPAASRAAPCWARTSWRRQSRGRRESLRRRRAGSAAPRVAGRAAATRCRRAASTSRPDRRRRVVELDRAAGGPPVRCTVISSTARPTRRRPPAGRARPRRAAAVAEVELTAASRDERDALRAQCRSVASELRPERAPTTNRSARSMTTSGTSSLRLRPLAVPGPPGRDRRAVASAG